MPTKAEQIEKKQAVSGRQLEEASMDVLDNLVLNDENKDMEDFDKDLHAYRYEELDDGSVVAIWGRKQGELNYKAFANMQEASAWSPRLED